MAAYGLRTDGRVVGAMENNFGIASNKNSRTLKVQDVGDYYRKEVVPQIKLQGKWLVDAGIQPDTHVQVTNPQPGVLVVKSLN